YWHRTVRVATAMIKKAVHMGLQHGAIRPSDLYGLDDELFITRFADHPFPAFALIAEVGTRRLLKPAADIAFDPADPRHGRLADMATRRALEANLASQLAIPEHHVIIDLPDPVSFEAHFPIFEEGRAHEFAAKSVFSPDVVRRFTETIRRIRLILPHEAAGRLGAARGHLEAVLDSVV
ncbi:MAG: hypothetical protein MI724_20305, partial [Spirochaetales bacterium]|nr:hypothetical protein [Spirochaetales bacterium]